MTLGDDPDSGDVELEGIEAGELVLEDLSCFADVVDELRLPPPSPGDESYRVSYPVVLSSSD